MEHKQLPQTSIETSRSLPGLFVPKTELIIGKDIEDQLILKTKILLINKVQMFSRCLQLKHRRPETER